MIYKRKACLDDWTPWPEVDYLYYTSYQRPNMDVVYYIDCLFILLQASIKILSRFIIVVLKSFDFSFRR